MKKREACALAEKTFPLPNRGEFSTNTEYLRKLCEVMSLRTTFIDKQRMKI